MKIAYIDMDDTLANYSSAIQRDYARYKSEGDPEYSHRLPSERLKDLVNMIRSQPNWWLDLEPIPLGFQIMERLKKKYKIHIATKGTRVCQNSWTEKLLWCQKHIGDVPVTVTHDKTLLMGAILVDDHPPYLNGWLENNPNGIGIMPVNNNNKHFSHPRVINVSTIEDLRI